VQLPKQLVVLGFESQCFVFHRIPVSLCCVKLAFCREAPLIEDLTRRTAVSLMRMINSRCEYAGLELPICLSHDMLGIGREE
jgi:hypothetical protein